MLAVSSLLAGCSLSPFIGRDVRDYQDTLATASDRVVLANVIRAKDQLPLHFSTLSLVHGSLSASAGGTLAGPFGPLHSGGRDSAGSSLSVASSPTFDVGTLDTQQFTQGLIRPLDPSILKYLLDAGLDIRLVLDILVASVKLHDGPLIQNLPTSPLFACYDADSPPVRGQFYLARAVDFDCPKPAREPEFFAFLRIVNRQRPFFANVYTVRTAIGPAVPGDKGFKELTALDRTKFSLIPAKTPGQFWVTTEEASSKLVLCEKTPDPLHLLHDAFEAVCRHPEILRTPDDWADPAWSEGLARINLRSISAIFTYLGQLLNYQERRNRCITIDFTNTAGDHCDDDVIFKTVPPGRATLSVTVDGRTYGLGDRANPRDHSTEALAVLATLVAMNTNAKDVPQTQTLQLVP